MNKIRIAFITGQSNKTSNALSPVQYQFLKSLQVPEEMKIYWNFPYDPTSDNFRSVNLITASVNNSRQYFQSRKSTFAAKYQEQFISVFDGEDVEKIVLLAGSCGLELYENLKLPASIKEKVYIFAYGAVARKCPDCKRLTIVRGNKDWIASLWRLGYNLKIVCNHMNYLESEAFKKHCQDFISSVLNTERSTE